MHITWHSLPGKAGGCKYSQTHLYIALTLEPPFVSNLDLADVKVAIAYSSS